MNCPKCGTAHDDNGTFCTSCGHAVLPDLEPDTAPKAPPVDSNKKAPKACKPKKK